MISVILGSIFIYVLIMHVLPRLLGIPASTLGLHLIAFAAAVVASHAVHDLLADLMGGDED